MIKTTSAALVGALILLAAAANAVAQQRDTRITGQDFLAQNETHKQIYVSGLMDGNHDLITHCGGNRTAQQIAEYLTRWLKDHPRYLTEPAHHAFTRAVTDLCED